MKTLYFLSKMKLVWISSLFFGAASANFGSNIEPVKLLGLPIAVEAAHSNLKLEMLKKWNSTKSVTVYGEEKLNRVTRNNPFYEASKKDVKFYLFTNRNPKEPVEIWEDPKVLARTHFNVTAPTKIICHGYLASSTHGPTIGIGPAYLKHMRYVNVIVIDWSDFSGRLTIVPSLKGGLNVLYPLAAKNTEPVGQFTAEMIDFLVRQGVSLGNIHLVGHSLGAHAMGRAGNYVQTGKVSRITGLDAAAPCFENNLFFTCFGEYTPLNPHNAKFVDVIHTNGRLNGFKRPIGQVDFYPNGGLTQPGCMWGDLVSDLCSHERAIGYFVESINPSADRMIGQKCSSWEDYEDQKCGWPKFAEMGEFCPRKARGKYFLTTNDKSPYAVTQFF